MPSVCARGLKARATGLAAAVLLSTGAVAQELRPLSELIGTSAEAYPFARCGALYQAMMEWIGEERMGTDNWTATNTSRETMILAAALTSQQSDGAPIETWIEPTLRDVRNIADLYIGRFEENYAAVGQAFGEDAVVQSDLLACKAFVEAAQ